MKRQPYSNQPYYQRNNPSSQDDNHIHRQDRRMAKENNMKLTLNTNIDSQFTKTQQQYRKHNSPDATKLKNYQYRKNQMFENQGFKNNRKNEEVFSSGKQAVQGDQKNSKSRKNENGKTEMNSNQKIGSGSGSSQYKIKTLTKTPSSPMLNLKKERPQIQSRKETLKTENDQYLKLHEKLNSIEDKILSMKQNIQRKRQQKQKAIQRQKREKAEQNKKRTQSIQPVKKSSLKGLVTQVSQQGELHSFQRNPYSSQHGIYYVSEVVRAYLDEKSIAREHILASIHILRILEHSQVPSKKETNERQVKIPYKKGKQNKKCIVFDLDETLIHCNDSLTPPHDVKLPITFPTGEVIEAGVNIRPYARQILRNLSKNFEVIVFTASHSCYANVVLDYLDPKNEWVDYRLFREHCYQTKKGMYVKDLRVMNRDLKDVLLVDNAAYSYAFQLDNGIPILPYYHGSNDYELKALQKYIIPMASVKDVRSENRKTFNLHRYRDFYDEPERMVEELYINEEMQQKHRGL